MNVRWLVAFLALNAGPAAASCSWEWLCNGEGVCKQMPICDTVYETPPPRPDTAPPAPPPLSMRPHAIAGNMQGLTCEHIMRQEKSGRWTWHEACFCSDPAKDKDSSTPFANIVRCTPPWKEDKAAAPATSAPGTATASAGARPVPAANPTTTAASAASTAAK
jgi:hypothetical protein